MALKGFFLLAVRLNLWVSTRDKYWHTPQLYDHAPRVEVILTHAHSIHHSFASTARLWRGHNGN